jgi:hypothetical protein
MQSSGFPSSFSRPWVKTLRITTPRVVPYPDANKSSNNMDSTVLVFLSAWCIWLDFQSHFHNIFYFYYISCASTLVCLLLYLVNEITFLVCLLLYHVNVLTFLICLTLYHVNELSFHACLLLYLGMSLHFLCTCFFILQMTLHFLYVCFFIM